MWILWQHLQPAKALHLIFKTRSQLFSITQAVLLMGDEKSKKTYLCISAGCSLAGRTVKTKRMLRFSLQSPHRLSVCGDKPPSARMTCTHTPSNTCTQATLTCMHAVPCNLLSPNYSRLEPMLLSLILSVRGLWGNSDISVWCLPYVSRALPGPINLIFNVCPTLDGPSQGWHSSRGDMIGVW